MSVLDGGIIWVGVLGTDPYCQLQFFKDSALGTLNESVRAPWIKEPHSLMKNLKENQEQLNRIEYEDYLEACMSKKETFETGAQKETEGKLRFDLIPPEVEKAYAEVLTFGTKKYSDRNWEKGIPTDVVIAALRRHLNQFQLGESVNAESGLSHLKHVLFWAAALVYFEGKHK